MSNNAPIKRAVGLIRGDSHLGRLSQFKRTTCHGCASARTVR